MPAQTQIQTRRGTAASWTSTNPTLAAGEIGFESDTGKFKIGNGSIAWTSLAYSAGATAVTYLFNATAAQTTFSGADANGLTLAYTVGAEQVYLNGALLVRGSDYTASNGTSIVLASGALVNDVLNVIAYTAMTVADTYTQAQADAKFFQTANEFSAGKNKIINGDFGVWQRGTSFTTNNAYTADRFQMVTTAGQGTISQQTFTPGTAPVAGYEGTFFLRYNATASNLDPRILQPIEDVRTFAGQTVTISFWAKSDVSDAIQQIQLNQIFGTGGSTSVTTNAIGPTLTSSWARYSTTIAVPSISGKTIGTSSNLRLTIDLKNSAAFNFDIWGVQVEAGSTATPFQTATGTIQGELAACQRYYQRVTAGGAYGSVTLTGNATNTTEARVYFPLKVTLRRSATAVDYANLVLNDGTNVPAAGTITVGGDNTDCQSLLCTTTGLTQFRPYILSGNNNAAGFLAISAEL